MAGLAMVLFIALFAFGSNSFGWDDPEGHVSLALFAAAVVVGVRAVQRRRRADRPRPGDPPAANRHAGVAALRAQLGRLGERASRLEALVTSREFELHRGFRELGD